MPDLEAGYSMAAKDKRSAALPATHNAYSNWQEIEITFAEGLTEFTINLTDPCLLSCFFPSTQQTIDSIFDFNTGTLETLGHDLDDVNNAGWLRITNGSKMSICPDFVFHNYDSITMTACDGTNKTDGDPEEWLGNTACDSCSGNNGLPVTMLDILPQMRINDPKRNMIIVNDKAALVLDSGSHTHVGTGSTLLVKSGATLLVKAGAMLEVGSECPHDRGELICERGSYVCVEEGADLHFFADIDSSNYLTKLDTVDRHIVYVAMPKPDPNNDGGIIEGSIAAVNLLGARGKFLPDSIYGDHECEEFCSWKTVNPLYGVNNREFGWCNISYPVSRVRMQDTFCPGDPIYFEGRRTLNETGYRTSICAWDTALNTCTGSELVVTDRDTFWIDHERISNGLASGGYRIRLITRNDCMEKDTDDKYIYVAPLPSVVVSLPDSGCAGYTTIVADGSTSTSGLARKKHRWSVQPIIPDSLRAEYPEREYGGDWGPYDSLSISSAFNFPGYKWTGGFSYAVSLTVVGWCGEVTAWDTIHIPVGAHVALAKAKVYSNPVGPSSFQLNGYAPGASSFTWSPTTYLDSPTTLHPIATPPGPMQYVFTVTDGTCTDMDTITVLHNDIAFAGLNQRICVGDSTMLGTSMDGVMLLGILYWLNPSSFGPYYESIDSLDLQFHRFFTPFLLTNYGSYYYSGHPYFIFTNMSEIRQLIHSRSWYANYFRRFVDGNGFWGTAASTFGEFRTALNNDFEVLALVDSLYLTYNRSLTESMLRDYSTYMRGHQKDQLSTTWEFKHPDSANWVYMDGGNDTYDWENFFNLSDLPLESRMYRLTVIDNNSSTVEYDTVLINVEDTLTPAFNPTWQVDSTISFLNTTVGTNEYSSYEWNFGDGGINSFVKHPSHTFAGFDTSFRVCLSVSNSCGWVQYCDTIRVDSAGIYGIFAKREGNLPGNGVQQKTGPHVASQSTSHMLSVNRPNPYSRLSIIDYVNAQPNSKAVLRVTSPSGVLVAEHALVGVAGQFIFDGTHLADGLYYYSLVIDGVVVKSRTMVIQH
jgi:hypothetical protein